MLSPEKRWISSVSINAAAGCALYAWKGMGIEGAGNVFLLWMWFVAIVFSIPFFIPARYYPKRTEPSIPWLSRFNLTFYVCMLVFLSWFGHLALSFVLIFGVLSSHQFGAMYDQKGNLIERSKHA